MNKREALKACLDGKTVRHGDALMSYDGRNFVTNKKDHVVIIAYLPEDGYELHVPEVTRAEAWAALDLGKTVKLVCSKYSTIMVRMSDLGLQFKVEGHVEWEQVNAIWDTYCNAYQGTKLYILDGEK